MRGSTDSVSISLYYPRYDHLMRKFVDPAVEVDAVQAFGLQIDVDRIAMHLAAHQSISVGNLIREKRSFGVFSPRRCDVYIYVSFALFFYHGTNL